MVSSFLGVQFGPLYYRHLDKDKSNALSKHKGDFDSKMRLSSQAISELTWWYNNIMDTYKPISYPNPEMTITTDASQTGWGAECQNISTGGLWTNCEKEYHINYLELFASFLGLKTFAKTFTNKHIRLLIDNTSAVSIINNMGTSHSEACHSLAVQMWEWCIPRGIWISAAHIPGRDNCIADSESRRNDSTSECMLNKKFLKEALKELDFSPDIDLCIQNQLSV